MPVHALIFDVFGTCVDWRSSIAGQIKTYLPDVDPVDFALRWRAQYQPAMKRVRDGARGYIALDQLHLENLQRVCEDLHLHPKADLEAINQLWTRLDPWPDVVAGLNALRASDYIIAPCSNGSLAMMVHLARYAQLPWDCILGAELAQDYKPKPAVYYSACAALQLAADRVMMVAAHNDDLTAARKAGLRTAFVPRITEYGADQSDNLTPSADWDIIATDFGDLAAQLSP